MISRKLLPSTLKCLNKLKPTKTSLQFLKASFIQQSFKRNVALYSLSSNFHFSTQESEFPMNSGTNSPYIVEVNTIQDFQKTIKESDLPIVLDCYANWCSPCRKLTPILEQKAIEGKGKFILMKYDIDKIPQLTTALKIRSVPSVILIHGGNAIDNFEGLPSDEVLKTFFETVDKVGGLGYSEEEYLKSYNEAINKLESNNFSEAIKLLKELQTNEQWVEKNGAKTTAALALSYVKSGDKNSAVQCLTELNEKYEKDLENEEVKIIVEKVEKEFSQKDSEASQLVQMKEELDKDPANNELRLKIAQYANENNIHEEAIDMLLDIIKIDRNFKNRAANTMLLEIFNKLGSTNPLVIQGRKKMQKLLY